MAIPYFGFIVVIAVTILRNATGALSNCTDRAIGVENKHIIPNSRFTASSYYNQMRYAPSNARLNGYNGWGPSTKGADEYLQIDLGYPYVICAIATQGKSSGIEWVKEYRIRISVDGKSWAAYKENGRIKHFTGNIDSDSIVKHATRKPLVRYIRFIPTDYKIWKTMRVGLYGYTEACDNLPLGMESRVIQDGNLTASSAQHPAKNARLNYKLGSSWCASSNDLSPYLQIDLGTSHLICAVAIQGNKVAEQWVTTYQINSSTNGTTWTTYQENNNDRVFSGSFDRSTVVRQVLYHSIATRYIRIVPKTYKTVNACLRAEIYGYQMNQTCSSHSVGIPSSQLVPNHRFTATSIYNKLHLPYMVRLGARYTWGPSTKYAEDYLQVDLGHVFHICDIETQGNGYGLYEWVTEYQVLYSTNNNQWKTYMENGTNKVFPGNTDNARIVSNAIADIFKAKFIRVLPTKFNKWKSIRVDFRGLPAGCVSSLGLEDSRIPDSQMTSSSKSDNSHKASRGRLYGITSWCVSTTDNTEYIQVDLGKVNTVTGIATQGDHSTDKWVTSYKVIYSFDKSTWYKYQEGQVVKVFRGNSNNSEVIVNWLNSPITTRYVRIFPQASVGGYCLRLDLYGCRYYVPESENNYQTISDQRSVILKWNNIQTNNGTANSFVIVILNSKTGLKTRGVTVNNSQTNSQKISNLKPFTKYEVKIKGILANGRPLWESTDSFTTLVAEPEGKPTIMLTSTSSQTITVSIQFTQTELLNGPMDGFRILYTPEGGVDEQMDVGNVKEKTLTNLKKYTVYSVSVFVRNTKYVGRDGNTKQKRTMEDVPDTGPNITRTKTINATTVLLTWQPLTKEQTNGVLTKYEIMWYYKFSSVHASGSCQELFTATTKGTQSIIRNIRPYAVYNVYVRGYTSVGPGPNSTVNFWTANTNGPDISSSTLCASQGNSVTIRCQTGKAADQIPYSWTKDGSPLVDTSAVKIQENALTLKPDDDKDFGIYECTAKNKEGTVTFMISKFELKKCSGSSSSQIEVVSISFLVVIIVLLGICIVYLIYRLKKTNRTPEEDTDNLSNNHDSPGIENEAITEEVGEYASTPDQGQSEDSQRKGAYMELKPIQGNKAIYESLDDAARIARENTIPPPQGTENDQYQVLKPVEKTLYEELHHHEGYENTASMGSYEAVGMANPAIDTSEV